MMDVLEKIQTAEARIRRYVRETPLERSEHLSTLTGAGVYLKLENVQHTGSFKFRGAVNKLLSLDRQSLKNGVVTASSGNHGMAVARAANLVGAGAKVFVASAASPAKIERIRRLGAEIETVGDNGLAAELAARELSQKIGVPYVSPYNDAEIIAGQGTLGVEIVRQIERIDGVFVSIGGGGLISGAAGYVKSRRPETEIIGCQPENSRVMYESVKAGRVLDFPEKATLSDGTAGGIEQGAITLPLCGELVDRFVLTSENEIKSAMREIIAHDNWIIEGSAGVAVAAFLKEAEKWRGKNVVIVICGKNIAFETLQGILT